MKKRKGNVSVAHDRDLSASQRPEGKYLKLKSRLALFLFSLLSPFTLCGKLQTACGARCSHLRRHVFVCHAPLMENVIIIITIILIVSPGISSHSSPLHQSHHLVKLCSQQCRVPTEICCVCVCVCFIVCFLRVGPGLITGSVIHSADTVLQRKNDH